MEQGKQLILHIYPPVEGSSEAILYSDANDGYGESRLDKFRMVRSENNLEITWEEHGEYPFPYTGVQLHLHGMKLQQAWVDDAEVACQEQIMECDRPLSGRFAPSRLARLPMPTARLRRTGASRKPGGTGGRGRALRAIAPKGWVLCAIAFISFAFSQSLLTFYLNDESP